MNKNTGLHVQHLIKDLVGTVRGISVVYVEKPAYTDRESPVRYGEFKPPHQESNPWAHL